MTDAVTAADHGRSATTPVGPERVNLAGAAPALYAGLAELNEKTHEQTVTANLEPRLVELIKIRTSQLNGCAFCLRVHTRDALRRGEDPNRLAVLPAWRETAYFSPVERAALALCEAVTLVTDGHVPDETYQAAAQQLSPAQLTAVSWLTIVMNALNRVAITSRYRVAPEPGDAR